MMKLIILFLILNLDEKSDEKIEDFLIRLKSLINQRKVFIETSKKGRI